MENQADEAADADGGEGAERDISRERKSLREALSKAQDELGAQ